MGNLDAAIGAVEGLSCYLSGIAIDVLDAIPAAARFATIWQQAEVHANGQLRSNAAYGYFVLALLLRFPRDGIGQ